MTPTHNIIREPIHFLRHLGKEDVFSLTLVDLTYSLNHNQPKIKLTFVWKNKQEKRVKNKLGKKKERKTGEHVWLLLANLKSHHDATTIKATQGWKVSAFQISGSSLRHARERTRKLAFHIREKRPLMIFISLANSPDSCLIFISRYIPEDHTLTNRAPLRFYIFILNESLVHENKPQNGKNSNRRTGRTRH